MTHQEAVDTLATERYLLDEMSDENRQTFEEHYFECETCADDLRVATAMLQGAKAGFAGVSTTGQRGADDAEAVGDPNHRMVPVRGAAVGGGSRARGRRRIPVTLGSPRSSARLAPVALVPVTLRPQSRGAEAVVPVDRQGGPVVLAIEVNDAPREGR